MAITNIIEPPRWHRRRSKIIFSFLSNQLAQPNFRYIIQVVQGGGTTPFASYLITPNAAGWVHFDMSSAIGDRVEVDTANAVGGDIIHELPSSPGFIFGKSDKGFERFRIRCGEYYGTPPQAVAGSFTSYRDVAVIDGVSPVHLGVNYNLYLDFGSIDINNKFWLTDRPITNGGVQLSASDSDRGAMAFLNNSAAAFGGGNSWRIKYEIFDSTGSVATELIDVEPARGTDLPSATGYVGGKLTYMGVLPGNISDADSGVNPAVVPSAITGWSYYTLQVVDLSGTAFGVALRVNNTPPPCKHDSVMLAWSNSVGGWDLFRMDGRTTISENSRSKQYQKLTGSYNAAAFSFNTYDRGDKEFFINREVVYTLNSGMIRESDARVLSGVMTSRNVMVYLEDRWRPVTVRKQAIQHGSNISKMREVIIQVIDSQREP